MKKFFYLIVILALTLPNLAAAQDAKALVDRGVDHSQKGKYAEAIKDFDQALQARPGDPAVLTYRGVVYYAKGQNERAIQDFEQAIKLDPKFGRAYYQRGMVYETMNRYDKALQDLQRAKSLGYKVDMDFVEMIKRKAAGEK